MKHVNPDAKNGCRFLSHCSFYSGAASMSKKIIFSDVKILDILWIISNFDSEADNLSDTSGVEYTPNIIASSSSSESEDEAILNSKRIFLIKTI